MNALEIKDLTKRYDGFSLEGVSFELPSGCIMGLIGENGAGKSTTIKLILDMIKRDGGEIKILGKDSRGSMELLKEDIGVVPDEIGLPSTLNAKQIGKIMKNTFANWDSDAYRGYLSRLSVPDDRVFKKLSKGMKMKLGIAIAMSHHPKLLILDEATSGLDPVVRDDVLEMLFEFTRDENHSILISSHIVSDLEKLCDYIAFLHKGRLILCEEKDVLKDEYRFVQGSVSEIKALPEEGVIGRKILPYGAEAIVKRGCVPDGTVSEPVDIEQLFVFMVRRSTFR